MSDITTQEIIGSSAYMKEKDAIVAYYLEKKTTPPEGTLLIGNYFPRTECNRTVLKFKSFVEIPVYSKEDALSFWKGKVRTLPSKEEKKEEKEGENK